MSNFLKLIFLSFFIFIASCKVDKKNPQCTDKYRWDVKTLTDVNASNINFSFQNTTVASLITTAPPATGSNNPRTGEEYNVYTVRCHIQEYKLSSDGDYHLVLVDLADPTKTMIGEIPDIYCESVQQSIRFNQIAQARKDFQNSLQVTAQVDTAVYTITGAIFYDKVHGQTGVAPNGVEIHPIISISK